MSWLTLEDDEIIVSRSRTTQWESIGTASSGNRNTPWESVSPVQSISRSTPWESLIPVIRARLSQYEVIADPLISRVIPYITEATSWVGGARVADVWIGGALHAQSHSGGARAAGLE